MDSECRLSARLRDEKRTESSARTRSTAEMFVGVSMCWGSVTSPFFDEMRVSIMDCTIDCASVVVSGCGGTSGVSSGWYAESVQFGWFVRCDWTAELILVRASVSGNGGLHAADAVRTRVWISSMDMPRARREQAYRNISRSR